MEINPVVILPALLVALNAFLKKMGMNDRWCPLVNVLGGFGALPWLLPTMSVANSILFCMMIGLSAGGFYDLSNNTVKGN